MPKLIPGTPAFKRSAKRHKRADQRRADRAKVRDLKRKRASSIKAQDIGRIPPVKDPERRAKAEASFQFFLETYLPEIFYLPWSKDLLRVLAKTESVVLHRDTFADAMPRGSGKTQIALGAALWAAVTGKHPFVVYVGAVSAAGKEGIEYFKKQLSENDRLAQDFPDICYPIRHLENDGRRCRGQRYKGKRTNIQWGQDRLVLPMIPGSKASGTVIVSTSMEGRIRGMWVRLPTGKIVRPTLAIPDDPQTSESARSQGPTGQTEQRLKIIVRDIQGLAGPDAQTAVLVPCTVIEPGDLADQLLDHSKYPAFRGERTKRLYAWPTNKALWQEYREMRDQEMCANASCEASTEFYRARRATCRRSLDTPDGCGTCARSADCMDRGAVVDWAARLDDSRNLSAVQAAMHSFYKYGPAGFAAEFQNEPLDENAGAGKLTAEAVCARYNGRPRGEVPAECTGMTMGVDLQGCSLWYVIIAWKPDFTGYIVDYGVWPRQRLTDFTLDDIKDGPDSLQVKYPGRSMPATVEAGLSDLIAASIARTFPKAGGNGSMRIDHILVDSGQWKDAVQAVKHRVGGSTMTPCKGVGIKAGTKPMSTLKRKPGERHRDHCYMPNVHGTREFPFVLIDTNRWKSNVHGAMLTPAGDPGAMTIFGDSPEAHRLFAAHLTAEKWEPTEGHGRPVQEWSLIPPKNRDNHWLDAAVYAQCAAAFFDMANVGGAAAPSSGVRKKRVPINEMLARRQHEKDQAAH